MGWIRHHGIVVTGAADDVFAKDRPYNIMRAYEKATELGLCVSKPVDGTTNGYSSLLVAPDGSKEGWETSDRFDELRAKFIEWLRERSGFDWFEYAADRDNNRLDITANNVE